jgi:hypothetical protein
VMRGWRRRRRRDTHRRASIVTHAHPRVASHDLIVRHRTHTPNLRNHDGIHGDADDGVCPANPRGGGVEAIERVCAPRDVLARDRTDVGH